jgi:hypothetical protein
VVGEVASVQLVVNPLLLKSSNIELNRTILEGKWGGNHRSVDEGVDLHGMKPACIAVNIKAEKRTPGRRRRRGGAGGRGFKEAAGVVATNNPPPTPTHTSSHKAVTSKGQLTNASQLSPSMMISSSKPQVVSPNGGSCPGAKGPE